MEEQKDKSSYGNKMKIVIAASIIGVVLGIIIAYVLWGRTSTFDKNKKDNKAILTVGDCMYTYEELMYYIYCEEEVASIYEDFYTQFYGDEYSYMDEVDEETGLTGQQTAKNAVIKSAKKDLVWYQEALKEGIVLSEEDKETAKKQYDEFCSALSQQQKEVEGMGKELLSYFEKQQVIEQYKNILLEKAEFDYDEIVATVDKNENRQYKYEFYEFYKTDENDLPYEKSKIKEYKEVLTQIAEQVGPDTELESLIPEGYEDIIYCDEDYVVSEDKEDYQEDYGVYKGTDIDEILRNLENGQMSPVLETEYSYIVFRMNNNNSTEYYDEIVEEEVTKVQNKIYNTAYKNSKSSYNMVVNKSKWNKIKLGNIIYGK